MGTFKLYLTEKQMDFLVQFYRERVAAIAKELGEIDDIINQINSKRNVVPDEPKEKISPVAFQPIDQFIETTSNVLDEISKIQAEREKKPYEFTVDK